MAENYLITGYWGTPHVTAENDRGIHAGIFGAGRFVLPVGEQFRVEYIGNNTIRMYDGKLMDNGAAGGIPAGHYVDLSIPNAGQGMNRNDLIVFQYSQDPSTLVERGDFIVVTGTESAGAATDPKLTEQDLLSNTATTDQMALWRVPVSGTNVGNPEKLFTLSNIMNVSDALHVENGGTGIREVPVDSFLVGNGKEHMVVKTPTEVRSLIGAVAMYTTTGTLTASSWANSKQTISVAGVTKDNTVIVTHSPNSFLAYTDAVIRCTAQGDGSLTFTCDAAPASDVNVNILVLT